MRTYMCVTRSGSVYVLSRDAGGKFWLSARNVPNYKSLPIPGDVAYPVDLECAWPPVVGRSLNIYARPAAGEQMLPQPSYITTHVQEVREVL